MKHPRYLGILFVLLILAIHFQGASAENSEVQPLAIGVIIPLSGPVAPVGETFRNSILLADGQFDSEQRVQFHFEDDGFIPRNTVSAAKRLTSQVGVGGLIVFGSSTSLAVADIAERAKIPMLSVAMSTKITEGRSFVFKYLLDPEPQNRVLEKELKRRGLTRIGVVCTQQDAMIGLRDDFLSLKGFTVPLVETVLPTDTDLKSIALKVVQAQLDGVHLAVLPPQIAILTRELRSLGYQGQLFGGMHLQQPDQVEAAAGAMDGVWFVTADDSDTGDFYQQYRERFGEKATLVPDGTFSYDVAKVFIEAIYSEQSLFEYLKGLQRFEGLFGTASRTKVNSFEPPTTLKIVRKGRFTHLR